MATPKMKSFALSLTAGRDKRLNHEFVRAKMLSVIYVVVVSFPGLSGKALEISTIQRSS